MPSKALLRPAEALREVRRIPGAAQAADGKLDVGAVLARRDEVVHNLSDETQLPWLSSLEIELVRGEARLDGERRVRVGEELLTAREAIVLAVGSTASLPPIPGLSEAQAWTNRQVTTTEEVPERLVILGGGVVGVEMAQAWSSLGSQVTVIEALERLLAREEPLASEEVQAALEQEGVELRTDVRAEGVHRDGSQTVVSLADGSEVSGDRLLVAIGRKPLTKGLGLESVGLKGGDYLQVDSSMRVNGLDWLYAVGDTNGRALLTHAGKYQARIAADNILGEPATAWADNPGPPRVVFTDPQVAAVGLTLEDARKAGIEADAIDIGTSANAGGSFYGRGSPGTSRFVVNLERKLLVGATFIGAEIADFLHAASVAVVAEVPLERLAHAIAAFPTRSEVWLNFLEEFETRHGVSVHARAA
jgi:dihydrolipoamide dehydrogenase